MCKSKRKKRFGFKDGLDNLLEVIFQVSNHEGVGEVRCHKRNNNRCNSESKNMCRGWSKGAILAILGRSSANRPLFAVKKKILTRTAASKGSSH